jgi:predicted lipoprotein
MFLRYALFATCFATPAVSDVSAVLEQHIFPRYAALADAALSLAEIAETDCSPAAVKPAFHAAFDAWISISHIQFGPIEDQGLGLAMAFWPDPKDRTAKALARLTTVVDPIVDDPGAFDEVSAAAQGFTALERVLYDPQPDADYGCRLTRAIARGLAQKSALIQSGWPAFASLMTTAGEEGNIRFQSPHEAQRALYTALSTGLEFLHDQRLGRPLGTFDRPRPLRAEARRSARSVKHIELALTALEDLAVIMHDGDLTQTKAAFAKAHKRASTLNDPSLAGVSDPLKRIRVETLQRAVYDIQIAVGAEIGQPLGISAGFNSLDGD